MSPPLRRLSSSLSFAARRAFATTPARRLEGGTYGVGYSPQAVHDITPITPRAKPPPYFYLTKPGMWKAIEKLESTNEELKRRLRDAHVFPLKKGMTPYTRPPIKWRKQEEVALLLGVGTMKQSGYEHVVKVLERLLRTRHVAACIGDQSTVDEITRVIEPFYILRSGFNFDGSKKAKTVRKERKPDEFGRTRTTGTRKTARAQVYLQFTKAVVETFENPEEVARLRTHEADLERKEEARRGRKKAVSSRAATVGKIRLLELDLERSIRTAEAAASPVAQADKQSLAQALNREGKSVPDRTPLEKLWIEIAKKQREAAVEAMAAIANSGVESKAEQQERVEKAEELAKIKAVEHELAAPLSAVSQEGELNKLRTVNLPETVLSPDAVATEVSFPSTASTSFDSPSSSEASTSTPDFSSASSSSPSTPVDLSTLPSRDTPVEVYQHKALTTPSPANSNSPNLSLPKDGSLHIVNPSARPLNADPILGQILINNVPLHRYFSNPRDRETILRPLKVARLIGAFNVFAIVKRGGPTGQSGAVALALARGIGIQVPSAKSAMRRDGLLSIDNRQVERKKTGKPKARKSEVWVKR